MVYNKGYVCQRQKENYSCKLKLLYRLLLSTSKSLYESESLSNLGLEEVEFDDESERWLVTVGFSRPWDYPQNRIAELAGANVPKRSFKVVHIDDETEGVKAVKNRDVSLAAA